MNNENLTNVEKKQNELNEQLGNVAKRQGKLYAYIVAATLIIVVSLSYALFFQVDTSNANQVVTAGSLTFTYSNGNTITKTESNGKGGEVCLEPMTSEEAAFYGNKCSYNIAVENTGTLLSTYQIKIKPSSNNEVDASYLKVILRKQNGDNYDVVVGPTAVTLTDGEMVLTTAELDQKQALAYQLQVYVDDSTYTTDIDNKVLSYDFVGVGMVSENENINPTVTP